MTRWRSGDNQSVKSSVPVVSLAGGYDLKMGHFLEVASMVVTWWIMAFFAQKPLEQTVNNVLFMYGSTIGGEYHDALDFGDILFPPSSHSTQWYSEYVNPCKAQRKIET